MLSRSCIASILNDNGNTLLSIAQSEIVHAGAFYDVHDRIIFFTLCDLLAEDLALDMMNLGARLSSITATDAIQRSKLADHAVDPDSDRTTRFAIRIPTSPSETDGAQNALDMIGGYQYLLELQDKSKVPSTRVKKAFTENCRKVWEHYLHRRAVTILTKRVDALLLGHGSIDEHLVSISRAIQQLQSAMEVEGPLNISLAVQSTKETLAKVLTGEPAGQPTFISPLDNLFSYFRPGDLYLIAARPGQGKTSLALHIMRTILQADDKARILFFNLEMTKEQLVIKLGAAQSGVNSREIEQTEFKNDQADNVKGSFTAISGLKLSVDDSSRQTTATISARCKRYCAEHPDTSVIFIDYLQLIGGSRHGQSEYEKISEISRELKILSGVIGVPVVALSQLSREDKARKPRPPGLQDLRGSGSLEQDSSLVMFLNPLGDAADLEMKLDLIIAKNRFGPCDTLSVVFSKTTGRFSIASNRVETKAQPFRSRTPSQAMDRFQNHKNSAWISDQPRSGK